MYDSPQHAGVLESNPEAWKKARQVLEYVQTQGEALWLRCSKTDLSSKLTTTEILVEALNPQTLCHLTPLLRTHSSAHGTKLGTDYARLLHPE